VAQITNFPFGYALRDTFRTLFVVT